jgi:RNA polymerase sigma factor (sigma-70 family)
MMTSLLERDAHRLVERARDAAIATDATGRIVLWNRKASELLEDEKGEVLRPGRPFHEALQARDVFGNRLHPDASPLQTMLEEGEGIQGFEMDVHKATGRRARVAVSVVAVLGPEPDACHMIHLLRELQRRRRTDDLLDRLLAEPETSGSTLQRSENAGDSLPDLTPRERQVLRLLADGLTTELIADKLHISVHTVRRHCQNLMRKLGIHSKVEAVALALRRRLI